MSSPDFHGEEITNPDQKRAVDERITALEKAMKGTAAAELAKDLVPVVPDGGKVGGLVTERRLSTAAKTRDYLRIWAPGITASAVFLIVVAVFEVPGPLVLYGLGIVGFGWWHAAGRPRISEAIRMLAYTGADNWARFRAAVTRLDERRGRHETRRTHIAPKSQ